MSLLIGYIVLAWTELFQTPPGGNVLTPLNIGITAQSKEGALIVGANSSVTTGLIVRYGNAGIGTPNPIDFGSWGTSHLDVMDLYALVDT